MKSNSFKIFLGSAVALATLTSAGVATASTTGPRTSPPTCAGSLVTSSKSPITLNFWEAMPKSIGGGAGNYGAIHALVVAFNKAEKGKIVVNDINQTGGYGQTWQNYVASLANHTSPNVVMFDQYNAQSAIDTGSILPVSTCITNNKYNASPILPKMRGAYTTYVNGAKQMVGMPYSASVPVMYYNKQAFAFAGIKSPPTTMAALIADQKLLQKTHWHYGSGAKATSGTYKYGVSFKYDNWEINTWLGLNDQTVVNQDNGHSGRTTAVSFNNSTARSYLTALQTIAKNAGGNNVYNPNGATLNQSYGNLFDLSGNNSAITFDTTAALGSIQALLPLFPNITMGIAPLPTLTGKVVGSSPPGGNGLFINKSNTSSVQQAAAWVFIQYLTSAKNLASWDISTGYLPIRTDEVSIWKAGQTNANQKAWYVVGYNTLYKGKVDGASEGPMIGPYDGVANAINAGIQSAVTPSYLSVSTALNNAASAANSAISNYHL